MHLEIELRSSRIDRYDRQFVRKIITQLPYNQREAVLRGYFDRYDKAYDNEPGLTGGEEGQKDIRKENAGRKAANIYLRGLGDERNNRG